MRRGYAVPGSVAPAISPVRRSEVCGTIDRMQQEPAHAMPAADMVWVPGGGFLMGSDHHYPEEAPAHRVSVGGFLYTTS